MTFEELGIKPIKSGRYSTVCPKCSPERKPEHRKNACLTVNNELNDQWWNCNHPGCDFRGNLSTYGKYDKVREYAKMPALRPSIYSQEVNEYLASRQISPEIAQRRGVYERKGAKGAIICYPYYYNKSLVNVMFRNIKHEKGDLREWQVPKSNGTLQCFWGLELLDFDRSKDIIITEGQTDAMTMDMCGYANVLSIPSGASKGSAEQMIEKLFFATDPIIAAMFEQVEKFYVLMDNDETGISFGKALCDALGKDRCWLPNFPKGYKDVNEVYAGNAEKGLDPLGKSGIDKLIETVYPFPIKGIVTASMIMDQIDKIAKDGFQRGLVTSNDDVDRIMSLKKGTLIGLTGVPGCFYKDQLVYSNKGVKPISEVKVGEKVLSYNHEKKVNEFRLVVKTHEYNETPDKLYKIKLKDGTVIKVTENHKFYTGTEYVKIKDFIASLTNERVEKNT